MDHIPHTNSFKHQIQTIPYRIQHIQISIHAHTKLNKYPRHIRPLHERFNTTKTTTCEIPLFSLPITHLANTPSIQMNIPERLAYQHHPPGSSLTFLDTSHHNDTDPDLYPDDKYDTPDPSPPHTYNPSKTKT